LLHEMLLLTFNIASRVLFSGDFTPYAEQILRFSELGNNYISKMLYLVPAWLPTPLNWRFQRSQKEAQQIMMNIIKQRTEDKNDFLTTLLAIKDENTGQSLSDQQILDE